MTRLAPKTFPHGPHLSLSTAKFLCRGNEEIEHNAFYRESTRIWLASNLCVPGNSKSSEMDNFFHLGKAVCIQLMICTRKGKVMCGLNPVLPSRHSALDGHSADSSCTGTNSATRCRQIRSLQSNPREQPRALTSARSTAVNLSSFSRSLHCLIIIASSPRSLWSPASIVRPCR